MGPDRALYDESEGNAAPSEALSAEPVVYLGGAPGRRFTGVEVIPMSVQAKIKANIRVDELKDNPITAGQPLNVHAADENLTLTDGVTAGKFDAVWSRKGVDDLQRPGHRPLWWPLRHLRHELQRGRDRLLLHQEPLDHRDAHPGR